MPLRAHLRELRTRLLLIVAGLAVGSVVGWVLYEPLVQAVQAPLVAIAEERNALVALNFEGVAAPLDMKIKLSLAVGVLVSSPWWIYQMWAFVTPGLTRRERWYAVAFVGAGAPLFLGGAALAWWVFPLAVEILTGFTPAMAGNIISAQAYLSFLMRMVLAFGLAFLLPVVMVGLTFGGLVTGRAWLTGWRWAVLVAFVFAAMATPTADAISMFALAVPICALYFGAVGICLLHDRRRLRHEASEVGGSAA